MEPAPRLAQVRAVADDASEGARYLGPFGSRHAAEAATEALLLAHPVRTCTSRIARRPRQLAPGCALAELGRCLAPCSSAGDREAYAATVSGLRDALSGDLGTAVTAVTERMARLADEERFEEAALWRERLGHLGSASLRTHRLSMLAAEPELVAARPTADHGWDIHLMRFGRLAGAAHAAPGHDPRPVVEALIASGEHVAPATAPAPAGLTEEALELLAWLDTAGVRLVRSSGGLALPRSCGGDLVVRLGEVRRSTHVAWHDSHDRHAVARTSRPSGPVDAVAVTRMLSA